MIPKNKNKNEISNRNNETNVPKPANGTPWVNQTIA